MHITGLSAKQVNGYRAEAARLIATYDRNGDGAISRREADQQTRVGSDSYSSTLRISNSYVNRTTVYQDTFTAIKTEAFAVADRNRDDELTADEIVESYMIEKDGNGNGDLGFFEKMGMSVSGMVAKVQHRFNIETNRRTELEYSPVPDYDRPTPPRPDSRPTPPRPDSRPTPPRPDSRPTPPRPNSRPTPPRPDNDRPAPPSSGDRPRPPRP